MGIQSAYSLIFAIAVATLASLVVFLPYPGRPRVVAALDRSLSLFEEWTLLITVLVALFAMFFNVVLRYGFNYTLSWSEELVREVIIYTTFIGVCAAVKNRSMIKIDASVQLFPRLKTPLTCFSNAVVLVFCLLMMVYGWEMAAMQARTFQKTVILQIPLVYLYTILPLTGMIMFIRTLLVFREDFSSTPAAGSRPR